jgi:hypothetical protein
VIVAVSLDLFQDNCQVGRRASNGLGNRQNALDIGESSILNTYLRKACVCLPFEGPPGSNELTAFLASPSTCVSRLFRPFLTESTYEP